MSKRRDRAAYAVAVGIWPGIENLDDQEMAEAYRIGDMVLAEADRVPDVSELDAEYLARYYPKTDGGAASPPAVSVPAAERATSKVAPPSLTDDGAASPSGEPSRSAGVGGLAAPSSPVLPRPFLLFRIRDVSGTSGTGVVAWGVEFPDGAAALRWNGPHPSTAAWPSVADIEAVHGHQGATVVHWLDGGR